MSIVLQNSRAQTMRGVTDLVCDDHSHAKLRRQLAQRAQEPACNAMLDFATNCPNSADQLEIP